MTVATWAQPDYTTDTPTEYKTNIDAATSVLHGIGGQFAAHEASTPNMTIVVDAGIIQASSTAWTEKAQQTSGTITAPSVNPRYDIAVINYSTGTLAIRTGSEAASPSDPALTAGDIPIARIQLQTSTTAITNSIIDDLRTFSHASLFGGQPASNYARTDITETFNGNIILSSTAPQIRMIDSDAGADAKDFRIFNSGGTTFFQFANDLGTITDTIFDVTRSSEVPQIMNIQTVQLLHNSNTVWNAGSVIQGPDGSVSAPAYSFSGDTNSGIYRIGADNIGVATNGTKRVDISDSTVNVTTTNFQHNGNAVSAPTIKVKTALETVNNTTTLQDDNHLAGFTLDSNSWYEFEAVLFLASVSGAGFKHKLSFSNTPQEIGYTYNREHDDAGAYYSSFLTTASETSSNTSTTTTITLRGIFQTNATTGGTLTLQWAQGTATVGNTELYAASFMKIDKFTPG